MNVNEREFALSKETEELYRTLAKDDRLKEFYQEFLSTCQGRAITENLSRRNFSIEHCSVEKRGGDNSLNLYLTVRPMIRP